MNRGRRWSVFLSLLMFAILANGCAVGNKYTYHDRVAAFSATGTKTVSIATHDQREYVVAGSKSPDFTGLQRGGFGNPFDVATASGKPLAEDMTAVMSASLSKKGFKTDPVAVTHSDTNAAIMEKLKKSGGSLLLLLTIKEWKSDTYQNVGLHYDLSLKAFDRDGSPLAEKKLQGEDHLGGSFLNPPAHARTAVPEALGKKMEELFNSTEIANTLR